MVKLLATVYGLIFLAELPDKTFFATLFLASRRSHVGVFAGAACAFFVQCAIAVALGSLLARLPAQAVRLAAAALFLGMSARMAFFAQDEDEASADPAGVHGRFLQDARAAFAVIFLAEWGDLTQLSTAALAAKYRAPALVLTASWLALLSVSALAVLAGNRLKRSLHPRVLHKAAAAAFAAVGAVTLVDALRR